jgi:hypothetical protein
MQFFTVCDMRIVDNCPFASEAMNCFQNCSCSCLRSLPLKEEHEMIRILNMPQGGETCNRECSVQPQPPLLVITIIKMSKSVPS